MSWINILSGEESKQTYFLKCQTSPLKKKLISNGCQVCLIFFPLSDHGWFNSQMCQCQNTPLSRSAKPPPLWFLWESNSWKRKVEKFASFSYKVCPAVHSHWASFFVSLFSNRLIPPAMPCWDGRPIVKNDFNYDWLYLWQPELRGLGNNVCALHCVLVWVH